MMSPALRLTPFDRAVFALLGALAASTLAVAWRGDRVGVDAPDAPDREPAVLFLRRDDTDRDQLFVVGAQGGETRAMTQETQGVWDFAVRTDGGAIAYSTLREGGGSDVVAVDRDGGGRRTLLSCPDAQCEGMVWAPDGQTVVFEKRTLPPGGGPAGPPKLWWLDAQSGQSVAVFNDSQHLGFSARFSPDGLRLAYINPDDGGVRIYTIDTATEITIESQMGEPASWRPDSRALALTNLITQGEDFFVHTLRLDLEPDGTVREPLDISQPMNVEDSQPSWSPDGDRLALARRLRGARGSGMAGRGIWTVAPDGTDAVQLTDEPSVHYAAPAWSPDGTMILCQRVDAAQPGAKPAIWRIDIGSRVGTELAADGFRPAWLP